MFEIAAFAGFGFRPPKIILALFLVLFPGFTGLGLWQLDRARTKDVVFEQFEAGSAKITSSPPKTANQVREGRYQQLRLTGRFDSDRQILLDAMVEDGRQGYHVLTPLALRGGGLVVVNRGWIEAPRLRGELPDVTVDESWVTISGRVDELPRPGLRLGADARPGADDWPRRMLFPDVGDLSAVLGAELLPFQLLLSETEPAGYSRRWAPRVMAPEKHRGYALQWFTFAAVALLGFVGFGLAGGKRA